LFHSFPPTLPATGADFGGSGAGGGGGF